MKPIVKMHTVICALLLIPAFTIFAGGAKEISGQTDGPEEIVWWHSNSGLLGQATDKLVKEFNETIGAEQGITVTPVYQGKAADVLTKLRAVMQGKDAKALPDIAQLDATGVIDIRDYDRLLSMDELMAGTGYDLGQIEEGAALSITYKDKMIGMPFNSSTILLYYNKDAFKEAGLDPEEPPKTIARMAEYAQRLVAKDENGRVERYGFAGVPTTYELTAWIGQQNGVSYLTDMRNGHDGNPTKVIFDENGTMEIFLSEWEKLWQSGGLVNLTSGVSQEFAAGKVAMIAASTSNLTTLLSAIDGKFELGVAYLPKVVEGADSGVNVGGGALFALDRGLDHQRAIAQFIEFAVGPEQQLQWHVQTGYFPVNIGTYELEGFKEHVAKNPLFQVAIDQLHDSDPRVQGVWIPSGYQVYYAFQNGIREMLETGKSVQRTVQDLAAEINKYISDYNRMNQQ